MNLDIAMRRVEEAIVKTKDGQKAFFDTRDFPWVTDVESHYKEIRDELDLLLHATELLPGFEQIDEGQRELTQDRRWKIFPFYGYGTWVQNNVRRCPKTVRALQKIHGLQAAMFSIFEPHSELSPHRGPYGGVLRYHLGLKVVQPEKCGITVNEDTAHWEEGKSLVFDDSHMHHAWNHSDDVRVVLFVDFVRPLPPPLSKLNEQVIALIGKSDFMQGILTQWKAWDAIHGASLDRALSAAARSD